MAKKKHKNRLRRVEVSDKVRPMKWLIFLVAIAVYANTLLNDYTLDDAIVIYDNEFTTEGFAGIPDLLRYDTFRGFFKEEGKEKLVSGGRYRPLTPVMYALEVQLLAPSKRDAAGQVVRDAAGHTLFDPQQDGKQNAAKVTGHLLNAVLFGLTAWLIFQLLHALLLRSGRPAEAALWIAAATALLFAVHPIHTEVVANIKGRDEIATLLGSLLALHFSLRAFDEKRLLWQVLAGLAFFLALMAKENAITWLAVVPLTYYFFTGATLGRLLKQTLPFVAATVVFLLIRASVLGWDFGGEPPQELMNNPFLKIEKGQWVDFGLGEKLATAMFSLGKYVQLLFFPHPLSHDYYPRAIGVMQFSDWRVLLSTVLYAGMAVYAVLGLQSKNHVSYGILYYLGTLSIVSNLVFPIGTNMGERFVYMPSLGFCLVVALVLWRLGGQRWLSRPYLVLGIAVLLLLAGKSVLRNMVWKDNFTLFTTDVRVQPNSAKLRTAAGGDLVTHAIKPANSQRKVQMLEEGVAHLLEAVKIHPTYKNAFLLLGNAHNYLERYDESIQYYEQALRIDPNYAEARNNLAITYANAGRYYGEQQGDLNKAIRYLLKADELKPNTYETLRLLGVAHGIGGQVTQAVDYFRKALELLPNDADALYNLGTAYMNASLPEQAEPYLQKARSINPRIDEQRGQPRQ